MLSFFFIGSTITLISNYSYSCIFFTHLSTNYCFWLKNNIHWVYSNGNFLKPNICTSKPIIISSNLWFRITSSLSMIRLNIRWFSTSKLSWSLTNYSDITQPCSKGSIMALTIHICWEILKISGSRVMTSFLNKIYVINSELTKVFLFFIISSLSCKEWSEIVLI